MTSFAGVSALLLLALAGGFLFAFICEYTRYPSLRGEGQQLYFFAAVFAVVLLFVSRLLITLTIWVIPEPALDQVGLWWNTFAGPLAIPALPSFAIAFILGPVAAIVLNVSSDNAKISRSVIRRYGSELEKFLYDAMIEAHPVYIALDNRKVCVGWPFEPAVPNFRKESSKEHFKLLPLRSGYLDEATLEPQFTAQYALIYDRIIEEDVTDLDISDFPIVIPLDRVMVLRLYSVDLNPELFKLPSDKSGVLGKIRQLSHWVRSNGVRKRQVDNHIEALEQPSTEI